MLEESDLARAFKQEADRVPPPLNLAQSAEQGGRRRLRRRRVLVSASLAVGIAAVCTAGVAAFSLNGPQEAVQVATQPSAGGAVPDFVGLTRQQAAASVSALGTRLGAPGRYFASATVPRGVVIGQSPEAGALLNGSPIELVYSAGGPVIRIADVPAQAAARLQRDASLPEQGGVVLVLNTAGGPAYKSDDVLTGTCEATKAAAALLRFAASGDADPWPDNYEETCY